MTQEMTWCMSGKNTFFSYLLLHLLHVIILCRGLFISFFRHHPSLEAWLERIFLFGFFSRGSFMYPSSLMSSSSQACLRWCCCCSISPIVSSSSPSPSSCHWWMRLLSTHILASSLCRRFIHSFLHPSSFADGGFKRKHEDEEREGDHNIMNNEMTERESCSSSK